MGGIDLNTLLSAGMAFVQAKQQGAAPTEALIQALMAGSQLNASPHHSQSGHLVANSLLSTISSMLGAEVIEQLRGECGAPVSATDENHFTVRKLSHRPQWRCHPGLRR